MTEKSFSIYPARTAADVAIAADLFQCYAESLDVDLAYQSFASELATLPGDYSPPSGELLIALSDTQVPLGCVAMRALPTAGVCEMKRLFLHSHSRGLGLGRALAMAIINVAERLEYQEMRLDSLPSMTSAIALYKALGFQPIEPYYETPILGTVFLARRLSPIA